MGVKSYRGSESGPWVSVYCESIYSVCSESTYLELHQVGLLAWTWQDRELLCDCRKTISFQYTCLDKTALANENVIKLHNTTSDIYILDGKYTTEQSHEIKTKSRHVFICKLK